jgi:hypothetical protein
MDGVCMTPTNSDHEQEKDRLYRPETLAAMVGVSGKTLRRWAKKYPDKLRVYKPAPTTVLMSHKELMAFIESSRVN